MGGGGYMHIMCVHTFNYFKVVGERGKRVDVASSSKLLLIHAHAHYVYIHSTHTHKCDRI